MMGGVGKWIAERLLDGPNREFVLGDLEEGFHDRRQQRGRVVASAWYIAMLLRSSITMRRTNHRDRPARSSPSSALRGIATDFALGLRMARRYPGVSLVAAVVIALGIGAATYAFGVHYGTFGRGLPVSAPDRMVDITAVLPDRGAVELGVSWDDFRDFMARQSTMDAIALWDGYETVTVSGGEGPGERITATYATAAFHALLEVAPLHGRGFIEGDDRPGAPAVAVISHALWIRRFGTDADIVGQTITVNGRTIEIVGVTAPDFVGFGEDIFLPLTADSVTPGRRAVRDYYLLGRLTPTASVADANEDFRTLAQNLENAYPETNTGVSARVAPFVEGWVGDGSPGRRLLSMVGGLMLVIAVANVTSLFLVRAMARSGEFHLRLALGAGRWRVIRLFLAEAAPPILLGAAAGAFLATFALEWYGNRTTALWEAYEVGVAHGVFVSIAAVVSLIGVAIVGAVQFAHPDSGIHEHRGSRGNTSGRFARLSGALVVLEFALGGAALFIAGLMIKTAVNLETVDYGFAVDDVMTATVTLDPGTYGTPEARQTFWNRLVEDVQAIPGVQRATLATQLPMIRYRGWTSFRLEGPAPTTVANFPGAYRSAVTPAFFETFDKPIREGRPFTQADGPHAEPVVIVNRDFVRRFFPDGKALDRLVKLGGPESTLPWRRIVGISDHLWMDTDVDQHPEGMYIPLAQHDTPYASVALRVAGDPEVYRAALRQRIMELDRDAPLDDVMTMAGLIHERTTLYRRTGPQFVFFGVMALILSVAGLYGVTAYAARRRTREIGIRMALGAHGGAVVRLILRQGCGQIGVGLALGVLVALYTSRGLSRFTFQLDPWDPWVLGASFGVLGTAALMATLLPARRAARLAPSTALRGPE